MNARLKCDEVKSRCGDGGRQAACKGLAVSSPMSCNERAVRWSAVAVGSAQQCVGLMRQAST